MTRSLIDPLPGYVENKVVLPKVLSLDEIRFVRHVSITLLASGNQGDTARTVTAWCGWIGLETLAE